MRLLGPVLGVPVGPLLRAGAAVPRAGLGREFGRPRTGALLADTAQVDDLRHRAILTRPPPGCELAADRTDRERDMGETVRITASDGHHLSAYAAGPTEATHGLVVVQEIFGVNRHMRHVCDAFGAEGYRVVAPALFDRVHPGTELGYGPEDVARGRELRTQVPEMGTLADIEAASEWLGDGTAVGRLGIVGYCWGGTVAWWGATRTSGRFAAAVGWYGGGIAAVRNEAPHCPVQLHFGETDASIPMADVEAIRAAQPSVEVFTYPSAGHGFGCDERGSYDPDAAALAQRRTLEFLSWLL